MNLKRTFKVMLFFVLSFLIIASVSLTTNAAWSKPTIKKDYVEPEVEFRAVWVCTVSNMDIGMQEGLTDAAIESWKNKYLEILDNSIAKGMNAIIFQVCPDNDAFYPSKYKPWSAYLAGYGVNPGWDPVEWMIEVTHAAGLEYHAWFNPYRTSTTGLSFEITEKDQATNSDYIYNYDETEAYNYKQEFFQSLKNKCEANGTLVDNPIFATGAQLDHNVVYGTEGKFVLNPAAKETVEHVKNTIEEFVTNYDADGIHFDDYFYPNDTSYKGSNSTYKQYTFSCEPDIDLADYNAYVNGGGELNIYDWRRDNVDTLIESLSNSIREINKTKKIKCAFGISPSARWAPAPEYCPVGSTRPAEGGMDSNCNDYYSYSDLFANTRKWVKEGWLDYILPQVYTNLGSSTAGVPSGNYSDIVKWWSNTIVDTKCKLYIGTALYQIDTWLSTDDASTQEFVYQQRWNQYKGYNASGYVMFRYKSFFTANGALSMKAVIANLWKKDALTPTYDSYEYESVSDYAKVSKLKTDPSGRYTVEIDGVDDAKAYGITEDGEVVARVLSGKSEIQFTPVDGKSYELITYGYDNQTHPTTFPIDLNAVEKNIAPVITFNSTIESHYLLASRIELSFTVTDNENDPLTYELYCMQGSKKYELITKTTLNSDTITYIYECFSFESKGFTFCLEVSDGYQVTKFESTSFDVVKTLPEIHEHSYVDGKCECGAEDPNYVAHEHSYVDGKCECGAEDPNYQAPNKEEPQEDKKGGCGSCGTIVVTLLSAISLVGIILRKRD